MKSETHPIQCAPYTYTRAKPRVGGIAAAGRDDHAPDKLPGAVVLPRLPVPLPAIGAGRGRAVCPVSTSASRHRHERYRCCQHRFESFRRTLEQRRQSHRLRLHQQHGHAR